MKDGAKITITKIENMFYVNYHEDNQNFACSKGVEEMDHALQLAGQFMENGLNK